MIVCKSKIKMTKANIMSSNMIHQKKKKKRKLAIISFKNQLGHFEPCKLLRTAISCNVIIACCFQSWLKTLEKFEKCSSDVNCQIH